MNPQNQFDLFVYRIKLLIIAIFGEFLKLLINLHLLNPLRNAITGNHDNPQLIVSLTSYGRRVHKVYYTIISLLRQTKKPDMVVLWLDNEHWNDNNIPVRLLRLQKKGLTIKYCKDLKSYKKLIPALEEYPNSMIITCDDDIYYKSNMVERLVEAYEKDPSKIYAHRAHLITYDSIGTMDSYNKWPEEISNMSGTQVFPTSGGGTLYKRDLLYKDICNYELFMKLSPKADDVWFFFMSYLNKTCSVVLPYKGYIYYPLDVFYQTLHKNSNLAYSNYTECLNDVQIKEVMDYYHINDSDMKNEF